MRGLFLRKNHVWRCWGLSLLNWIAALTFTNTTSKKVVALIRSTKFLSSELALYILSEYSCHVWAGAPCYYLDMLVKIQKRICRIVVPSPAASLEPLAYRGNVASLSLFCIYYFGRCSSELAQLFPLLYSLGRSTGYSDRLHDFSVTIPRYCKDGYYSSLFPRTARLELSIHWVLSFDQWFEWLQV